MIRGVNIAIIFVIGFLLGSLLSTIDLSQASSLKAKEIPSPQIRIGTDSIAFLPDKVIINKPGIMGSTYTNTNSMDPILDQGMTGLSYPVNKDTELYEGDIITYDINGRLYTHTIKYILQNNNEKIYIVSGTTSNFLLNSKVPHNKVLYVKVGNIF
jgi:hypothetical protein